MFGLRWFGSGCSRSPDRPIDGRLLGTRHLDTLLGVTDPGMCLLAQKALESESC